MMQKNCEDEIQELSRDQQEMLDEHIDRLNKVFKGKDNYAGIAVPCSFFVGYRRMDRHTVHQNLYNEVRKADKIV